VTGKTTLPRNEIEIRPLAGSDFVDWARLWQSYLAFYQTALDPSVYRSTFARLVSGDAGEYRGFLALADGKPVGLAHYLFHRSTWQIPDICYLQDLYVDPAQRGTGLGRALIEAVYAAADAEGAPDVYWLTQEFNSTARRLYDRLAQVTPFLEYDRP
jgi:GNAT superfamily N-acetyltransferase